MSLLLMGYFLGLKTKIRQIMWLVLVTLSMFVVTNATFAQSTGSSMTGDIATWSVAVSGSIATGTVGTGTATATVSKITPVANPYQGISIKLDHSCPVLYYLTKLLSLENKYNNLEVYDERDFYVTLITEFKKYPTTKHLDMFDDVIEALHTQKYKHILGDTPIVFTILQQISVMIHKDMKDGTQDAGDDDTDDDTVHTSPYTMEKIAYGTSSYLVYTLKDPHTIKIATMHLADKSTQSCLYSQCNSLTFPAEKALKMIYFVTTTEQKGMVDVEKTTLEDKEEKKTPTEKKIAPATKKIVSPTSSSTWSASSTTGASQSSSSSSSDDILSDEDVEDIFGELLGGLI